MPVSVIVGGQFGSEGKGKVAHFFAKQLRASVAVRVGGPNSGHTVIDGAGRPIIFRQLPTAAILPDVRCVLPAGSYIVPELLQEEMSIANISAERLLIDPNAVVISETELALERSSSLKAAIGSTQSGTGAAVVARVERMGSATFAYQHEVLRPFVKPTTEFISEQLQRNQRVIIEGTQGFGLSVLHSPHYPYVTSRDTTAAGFLAEAGLSPLDVDDVILVIRAFPIRVEGKSGPLPDEISWDEVTREAGSGRQILERTSVTKTVRRVARFGSEIVREAILFNRPTCVVINHVDYIDAMAAKTLTHTGKTNEFLRNVEAQIGWPITYCGLGPNHLVRHSSDKAKRALA